VRTMEGDLHFKRIPDGAAWHSKFKPNFQVNSSWLAWCNSDRKVKTALSCAQM
jgi:hypothetical protein